MSNTATVALSLVLLAVPLGVVTWWLARARESESRWKPLPGTALLYEPAAHVDASRLAVAAQLALDCLAQVWPAEAIAGVVGGWPIRVHPANRWYSAGGLVGGQVTHDNGTLIVLVGRDLSALAHELAHLCQDTLDGKPDADHSEWFVRGITAADNRYRDQLARLA